MNKWNSSIGERIRIPMLILLISICITGIENLLAAPGGPRAALDVIPSKIPRQIILTWSNDPATTQSVTWRTDTTIMSAYAELALADDSPNFIYQAKKFPAATQAFGFEALRAHYHSVTFRELEPNTLYAYRVGSEGYISEWFHFRTAAATFQPFIFLYFGDAQVDILSHWSRVIRSAFLTAPE